MNTRTNKLLSTVVSKKKVGNTTQTSLQISMKDKSKMTSTNVQQMISKFQKTGRSIAVRGLNIERWMTLKSLKGDYDDEGLHDYYNNKVGEEFVQNFVTFSQIQLTLLEDD